MAAALAVDPERDLSLRLAEETVSSGMTATRNMRHSVILSSLAMVSEMMPSSWHARYMEGVAAMREGLHEYALARLRESLALLGPEEPEARGAVGSDSAGVGSAAAAARSGDGSETSTEDEDDLFGQHGGGEDHASSLTAVAARDARRRDRESVVTALALARALALASQPAEDTAAAAAAAPLPHEQNQQQNQQEQLHQQQEHQNQHPDATLLSSEHGAALGGDAVSNSTSAIVSGSTGPAGLTAPEPSVPVVDDPFALRDLFALVSPTLQPAPWNALGLAYLLRQGTHESSQLLAALTVGPFPQYADARCNLAIALLQQDTAHLAKEATAHLHAALLSDKRHSGAMCAYGALLTATNHSHLAVDYLGAAKNLDPYSYVEGREGGQRLLVLLFGCGGGVLFCFFFSPSVFGVFFFFFFFFFSIQIAALIQRPTLTSNSPPTHTPTHTHTCSQFCDLGQSRCGTSCGRQTGMGGAVFRRC
jgi:hypothetical protein